MTQMVRYLKELDEETQVKVAVIYELAIELNLFGVRAEEVERRVIED